MYNTGMKTNDEIILSGRALRTGIKAYDEILSRFPGPYTVQAIRDYILAASKQYRPATVRIIKAAFKKAVAMRARGYTEKAMIDAAFRDIKAPKVDRKVYAEDVPTYEDIEDIKNVSSPRVRELVAFLADTGLRITEALSIRIENMERKGNTVFINIVGKGNKERRIFFPVEDIARIRSVFNSREYLFERVDGGGMSRQYAWKAIQEAGARAGVRVHPHSFRHFFASDMIARRRHDVAAVSNYLGHASAATTLDMYVHSQLKPEDVFRKVG